MKVRKKGYNRKCCYIFSLENNDYLEQAFNMIFRHGGHKEQPNTFWFLQNNFEKYLSWNNDVFILATYTLPCKKKSRTL